MNEDHSLRWHQALHVVGVGARTSLGLDLLASAAGARAGLSAFAEHPFMIDNAGFAINVARDTTLPAGLERNARIGELAASAAVDAVAAITLPYGGVLHLNLLLALAAQNPAMDGIDVPRLVSRIERALGNRIRIDGVRASRRGHTAGIEAAQMAAASLDAEPATMCLLLGADSWLDASALEWLDEVELLRVRTRPFGFVPGEAAAAVLLSRRLVSAQVPTVSIRSAHCTAEPVAALAAGKPRLGHALTAAARAALQTLALERCGPIQALYADLNGLPERADEVGYLAVRVADRLSPKMKMITPAEWFGDVGAASVLLSIGLAGVAAAKRYGSAGQALLLAQSLPSDAGADRGALVLESMDEGDTR